jgi:hypothetical protein
MTPLQKFNTLPSKQRDEILDKYRQWNVEHVDWGDCVYETFKCDMAAIGVRVDKMFFSGFWSQGDGACFEGRVEDWPLFLTSIGYTDAALIAAGDDCCWSFSCEHRGYSYYHHKTVTYSTEINLPESTEDADFADRYLPWEPDDIRTATMMASLAQYTSATLIDEFATVFENYMLDLYKQLGEEYEHLTSDESIRDSLDANDQLEEAMEALLENEDA